MERQGPSQSLGDLLKSESHRQMASLGPGATLTAAQRVLARSCNTFSFVTINNVAIGRVTKDNVCMCRFAEEEKQRRKRLSERETVVENMTTVNIRGSLANHSVSQRVRAISKVVSASEVFVVTQNKCNCLGSGHDGKEFTLKTSLRVSK